MQICSRTGASLNGLSRVISLHPKLTDQILKLINSTYYSLVNKVTLPTRAITRIICSHHDVETTPEEHRVRAAYVEIAYMYTNIHDFGYTGNQFPDESRADQLIGITGLTGI